MTSPLEPQFLICKMGMIVRALWDCCEAHLEVGRRNTV